MDSIPPLKRCTKCRNRFPLTQDYFSFSRTSKDGFKRSCKNCEHLDKRNMKHAPNGFKYCPKCKQTHPATEEFFYPDRYNRSGLRSYCRSCTIGYSRSFRTENPEMVIATVTRWKKANHEKSKSYQRTHYHNNKETVRAKQHEYSLLHSDEIVQRVKDWKAKNPDRARVSRQVSFAKRRAREASLPNTLTKQEWESALEHFGGKCAVCGRSPEGKRTIAADHWQPIAKGGGTTPDNIIPLCHGGGKSCNENKGARDPAEWLLWQFGHETATEILTRINTYFEWVKTKGGE